MDFFRNTALLWLSVICIVGGYIALAAVKLSIGPILLVGGYCVLLPVFIWRSFRKSLGE